MIERPLRGQENVVRDISKRRIPTWSATLAPVITGAFFIAAGCSGVFLLEGF